MKTAGVTALQGGGVTSPKGFRAGAVRAGVKETTGPVAAERLDLAVVVADGPCVAAAVFTQCQVVAAPVIVTRARLASGTAQGIVINSGNANACTGEAGLRDAERMADAAAAQVRIDPSSMLVASTGVIGVPFPIEKVTSAMAGLRLAPDGGHDAARAIMTTDLVPKEFAAEVDLGSSRVIIGGMAKGSGMIHPNMATMLAVVTTDAPLDPALARSALRYATDRSFNQVSVDRDTSTNDMLLLLANGAAGGETLREDTPEGRAFTEGLTAVCVELARKIARDGEGASKLIEVRVEGAADDAAARQVARAVVSSNLLKAAVYGCDPNWGRILSAIGNAGVPIDPDRIDAFIGDQRVARDGMSADFDAAAVSQAMAAEEVCIRAVLHVGPGSGVAWGCDLTEGYVKINAEYTT